MSTIPRTSSRPVLDAVKISVSFSTGIGRRTSDTRAVSEANLALEAGQIVGLVGESGSGKSTLARVICGLQREYTGQVLLDGIELNPRRSREQWQQVQMVFQDPYSSLDPRMTVERMFSELLWYHRIVPRDQIRRRCEELLDLVRLPAEFLDRLPGAMSGGQRQRVAIARALALGPRVLVADEAVSALDVSVQAEIVALLSRLRDELGLTVLFISHDLAVVRKLCDRVYVIHRGVIVEENTTQDLFSRPTNDYTRQLLQAVPRFTSAFLGDAPATVAP